MMNIDELHLTIRDVTSGYLDNGENGVTGYDGRLNIRPPYQREFVYKQKQRDEVIKTIRQGFPLNAMYWISKGDGTFELLDGQQRTVSFCQYVNGDYSIEIDGRPKTFDNLSREEQNKILDYKLMIYSCEGTEEDRIKWFEVVNTSGEKLTPQELRNAIYSGPWTISAKRIFSKTDCAAYNLSKPYVNADVIRQGLLELAIKWIVQRDGLASIDYYMSAHKNDPNANELWSYFRSVINWVMDTFPTYHPFMKGVNWASLYDRFHNNLYDTQALEERIKVLSIDNEIGNRGGIYEYILSGDEHALNLRAFPQDMKLIQYEIQQGICPLCEQEHRAKTHYEINEMEADHVVPWSRGGKTVQENCRMLCREHNRRIGNR